MPWVFKDVITPLPGVKRSAAVGPRERDVFYFHFSASSIFPTWYNIKQWGQGPSWLVKSLNQLAIISVLVPQCRIPYQHGTCRMHNACAKKVGTLEPTGESKRVPKSNKNQSRHLRISDPWPYCSESLCLLSRNFTFILPRTPFLCFNFIHQQGNPTSSNDRSSCHTF